MYANTDLPTTTSWLVIPGIGALALLLWVVLELQPGGRVRTSDRAWHMLPQPQSPGKPGAYPRRKIALHNTPTAALHLPYSVSSRKTRYFSSSKITSLVHISCDATCVSISHLESRVTIVGAQVASQLMWTGGVILEEEKWSLLQGCLPGQVQGCCGGIMGSCCFSCGVHLKSKVTAENLGKFR